MKNPPAHKKYLINWIKKEVKKSNAKGVVFGISGGVDSALVASLVKQAFPKNHLALWMGIESSKQALENANLVAKELDLNYKKLDLTKSLDSIFKQSVALEKNITKDKLINIKSNIKSRIRMIALYEFAALKNYLVVGTSNYSEYYLGYFTKWGDAAADIYPIINLKKADVYLLAKEFNVNKKILEASPSADLYPGQTDEKEMKVTYKEIDDFLAKKKISSTSKQRILWLHNNSKHKRQSQPNGPKLLK